MQQPIVIIIKAVRVDRSAKGAVTATTIATIITSTIKLMLKTEINLFCRK